MFTSDIIQKIIVSLQKMKKNSTPKQNETRKLFDRIKIWACENNMQEIEVWFSISVENKIEYNCLMFFLKKEHVPLFDSTIG